jgi:hypothetical protein
MIIENQNASYRFASEIGRHRRCDDSVDLPSFWTCGITKKPGSNVRQPGPFRIFSTARTRSCARVAVVIKPWGIHTTTLLALSSLLLVHVCRNFYSPRRGDCRSLLWLTFRERSPRRAGALATVNFRFDNGYELPIQIPTRNTKTPPTIT